MEQLREEHVRLEVENIGGIEQTTVEFEPGVTVLTGRNATNRTSLLQAIMAGLGSDRISLKGDADAGSVTLQIGDETYTRRLNREGGDVVVDGDPYLTESEFADLFAFLLESNETRRTVAMEENLRDIIMEPIDVEEIQAEIRRLQSQREEVTEQVAERESLEKKRAELERRRNEVESDIENKEATLEDKRVELEAKSGDASEAQDEQSRLDERMETLQEKQSALEDIEFRLETQRESIDSLQEERDDLADQYGEFEEEDLESLDAIRSKLNGLRNDKQRLDSEMNELQSIIQFNEEMLEGTNQEIAATLRGDNSDGSVTDQLLDESGTVVCWTCGTEVDRDNIEDTLERLRTLRESKYSEKQAIDDELDELKETKSQLESRQQERQSIERRLEDVREEIADRESKIDELGDRREELTAEITDLEDEVAELERRDGSDVLAVHREINELEIELDRLETERNRLDTNINELDAKIEELSDLESRKERINAELEEHRTRIERIEQDAIETFNDHMETVLSLLNYKNIERIWVERVERETRDGRRKVTKPEFRLHTVRSTDDGVTYKDDFTHLSESEREVTGLIFALAGYLAHDVYEDVPFMLLDSLEAIDSERIATFIDYLEKYADYLVVALLPEDANALDVDYQRITDI